MHYLDETNQYTHRPLSLKDTIGTYLRLSAVQETASTTALDVAVWVIDETGVSLLEVGSLSEGIAFFKGRSWSWDSEDSGDHGGEDDNGETHCDGLWLEFVS